VTHVSIAPSELSEDLLDVDIYESEQSYHDDRPPALEFAATLQDLFDLEVALQNVRLAELKLEIHNPLIDEVLEGDIIPCLGQIVERGDYTHDGKMVELKTRSFGSISLPAGTQITVHRRVQG
jgi:hypothetical protein